MNLSISHLYTYSKCSHKNIGILKNFCQDFSIYNLREGVNILQGAINGNGWALTNCLCNSKCKINDVEGDFYVNNELESLRNIRKCSYYICQSELNYLNKFIFKKAKKIIHSGNDDIYNFLLQNGVLERDIDNLGNWRYIISFYIGYQKGRKIFGFPWLSASQIEIQSERLQYMHNFAVINQLCIILPCEYNSNIHLKWTGYHLFDNV